MQHRAAGQTRTQAGLNKLTCLPTSCMGVAIVCSVNRLDTFIKHIQKLSSCLQVCGPCYDTTVIFLCQLTDKVCVFVSSSCFNKQLSVNSIGSGDGAEKQTVSLKRLVVESRLSV